MRSLLFGKDEWTVNFVMKSASPFFNGYWHRLSDLEFGLRYLQPRLQAVVETRTVR